MKRALFRLITRYFDKKRGRLSSIVGLVLIGWMIALYKGDADRYMARADKALMDAGKLLLLAGLLRRNL